MLKIQIFLILITMLCFVILAKNVKRQKMKTDYAVLWLGLSFSLIIIAVFPSLVYFVSDLLGIETAVNSVFLIIIFLMGLLIYSLYLKVSIIEEKQKNIIQEFAIYKKEMEGKDQ